MAIITQLLLALGGVTLFLFGLKLISDNMQMLAGNRLKKFLMRFTRNDFYGVLTGAISTSALQSSIATNVIAVGFVEKNIITFRQAMPIIMGANIGTTVTAQLVSLSGSEFSVTAIGSLAMFIGFILTFLKNQTPIKLGNVLLGFGLIFFGLDVVSSSVSFFKGFLWFRNIFLVKNVVLLFFNGVFITALVQSSSAVSSVIILLASNGLISFESSMFLILGANVGTCFSVIISAFNKGLEAQKTAQFNLVFNVFGSLIFFIPLWLLSEQIAFVFGVFSGGIERQIANFHTLFNILVTLILTPFLTPLSRLVNRFNGKNDKNRVVSGVKSAKIVA
ncbi:MAG: Na/Pi cotransporter family protein [Clostridia bacterium]|nr:Na/Pi cotransporter family protein [Clostridia bacterium]